MKYTYTAKPKPGKRDFGLGVGDLKAEGFKFNPETKLWTLETDRKFFLIETSEGLQIKGRRIIVIERKENESKAPSEQPQIETEAPKAFVAQGSNGTYIEVQNAVDGCLVVDTVSGETNIDESVERALELAWQLVENAAEVNAPFYGDFSLEEIEAYVG